jgi:pimeloyl-ACP methyl ester carboxylesterase
MMSHEISLAFGPEDRLIGTVTLCAAKSGATSDLGFVFFNAGVVHRIGPHRINVKLARALAKNGVASIRFDLAGLGDSGRHGLNATISYSEQAAEDIRAAIDALAARSPATRFVLCAVCSGTVHSYAAAVRDPRIAGLILLDGYMYPTTRAQFNFWTTRVRRRLGRDGLIGGIARLIKGAVTRDNAQARQEGREAASARGGPGFFADRLPKAEFARLLNGLASRGTRVLFVYAGSNLQHYNYAGQFKDAFSGHDLSPLIEDRFLPYADHTMTRVAAQREFVELVAAWTSRHFLVAPVQHP